MTKEWRTQESGIPESKAGQAATLRSRQLTETGQFPRYLRICGRNVAQLFLPSCDRFAVSISGVYLPKRALLLHEAR
jgi:hypothetical protein